MAVRPIPLMLLSGAACFGAAVAALGAREDAKAARPMAPQVVVPTADALASRIYYPTASPPRLMLPDGRAQTIRSVLRIEAPMKFGDYRWDEGGVPPGPLWVRVDIARQLISVFRGEHEVGSAVILYGAERKPTPLGAFPVLQKAEHYHSRTYDAPMPYMLRLTPDGVAIHASDVRQGWATHGCIGVPEPFARHLFEAMQLGEQVYIVG